MAHLGSFGTPQPVEADTFEYFGEEIRTHPVLSDLALHDFLERATLMDEAAPAAYTATKDFIRELIHPDDFDRFWALARSQRQQTADLMAVAKGLFAAVTARPTGRPAVSSGGSRRTKPKSTVGSSSRVLQRLSGRPDLQLCVVAAQEARAAG